MAWLKKSVDGHYAVSDGLGGFDFNLTMELSSDMRIGSSSTSPDSAVQFFTAARKSTGMCAPEAWSGD